MRAIGARPTTRPCQGRQGDSWHEQFRRSTRQPPPGVAVGWQRANALRQRHRLVKIVPIVLRCSRQTCLERIDRRHAAEPSVFDLPARFMTDPRILAVFDFVEAIDDSQAVLVEAERTVDDVYVTVARLVAD